MTANGAHSPTAVGAALRRAREEAKLTQAELAARMPERITQGYVTRWETGTRTMHLDEIADAEAALALAPGSLLKVAGFVAEAGDTRAVIEADIGLREPWRSMVLAAYDLGVERSR